MLIEQVYQYMKKENMIKQGDRVLVGVSGGADSVCLLFVLCQMKKRLGIEVSTMHIHHGIRGREADRDACFVSKICERLEVPCQIIYRDIPTLAKEKKMSEEETGRMVRYEQFERIIAEGKADKIAVAHNKSDNAETILFNLFRGSGVRGLSGILPVRGRIIRPLLMTERKDIEEYLKQADIEWQTDTTNLSARYARNKLRLQLIPLAEEINKKAVDNIVQAGNILREAEGYLQSQALLDYERLAVQTENRIEFAAECLNELPLIIRKYVLKTAIGRAAGKMKDITWKHIEAAAELLDGRTGRQVSLPYQITVRRSYDKLYIEARTEKESVMQGGRIRFSEFACTEEEKEKISKNRYTKWFDYDKIKGTLSVRHRKEGDYIRLFSHGGKKAVSRYMIDNKIPREDRDRILLLADDEEVLWIIGWRINEAYKVTERTKRILQAEFFPEEV